MIRRRTSPGNPRPWHGLTATRCGFIFVETGGICTQIRGHDGPHSIRDSWRATYEYLEHSWPHYRKVKT